jgi:hypothetical protein
MATDEVTAPLPSDHLMARVIVLVARRAEVAVEQAEVLAALLLCGHRAHQACRVDELLRQRAAEQGVPWPD